MFRISIVDLEVHYRIGVTDEERAKPQRLLLTVEMTFDLSRAAASDRLEDTTNYQSVADELLQFGERRSWNLLEKLTADIADSILANHKPARISVEAKKFIIPQARFVSVTLTRRRR